MTESTSILEQLDDAAAKTAEHLEEAIGSEDEEGIAAVHNLVVAFQKRAHELAEGVGSEVLVDELLRYELTGIVELLTLLKEAGL